MSRKQVQLGPPLAREDQTGPLFLFCAGFLGRGNATMSRFVLGPLSMAPRVGSTVCRGSRVVENIHPMPFPSRSSVVETRRGHSLATPIFGSLDTLGSLHMPPPKVCPLSWNTGLPRTQHVVACGIG